MPPPRQVQTPTALARGTPPPPTGPDPPSASTPPRPSLKHRGTRWGGGGHSLGLWPVALAGTPRTGRDATRRTGATVLQGMHYTDITMHSLGTQRLIPFDGSSCYIYKMR